MANTERTDLITSLVNLGDIDSACDHIVTFVMVEDGTITQPMANAWMALALSSDPTASESAARLRDCIRDNSDISI